jgi:hypothetical protein
MKTKWHNMNAEEKNNLNSNGEISVARLKKKTDETFSATNQ